MHSRNNQKLSNEMDKRKKKFQICTQCTNCRAPNQMHTVLRLVLRRLLFTWHFQYKPISDKRVFNTSLRYILRVKLGFFFLSVSVPKPMSYDA